MHRTWTGALATALALLAVSGCGGSAGSDDDGGGAATNASAANTLTATQLRSKAEAICAPFAERYTQLLERAGSGGAEATRAERRRYARAIDRTVRLRLDIADQLDALAPPPALRSDYEDFVQALRDTARGYPTVAETMASEDPRARMRDDARLVVADLGGQLRIGAVCGG